jgi:hypothetical protein
VRTSHLVRAALVAGLALAGQALGARSARAQVVVGIQASGISMAPGGFVTVPVVVDMTGSGGFSLGSFGATLTWKASTLRFVGAASGGFAAPAVNPDSATGTLRFAVANPGGATGRVVVLLATFNATGPAGDTTYLTLAVNELTSAVTFTNLTPVTTTSLVCVGSVTGTWGDLDNSGTVTSFDALLIVTYAVGLSIAPNSPALGDVDLDGKVTTRDALIILSHVVGLPTPGFRPGQSLSQCGGNPPAAVAALPSTLALVVGDTVAATAQVTDSIGQIVAGPGLAWTTLNPAIATVTPSGRVAAVGAGVTGVVVVAAPGVMDTVGVTVAATRRQWYVDAGAAAQNQQETGSPSYPFSTLQQAVDRAAANDTVLVRGGAYGTGARSVKPLTITGEAGFAMPRFGGPIEFDSLGADTVWLRRLVVADAPTGVQVRSLGGVLAMDSVTIERAGGHYGLEVMNADSISLRGVAINGAQEFGIRTIDVRALALAGVTVDGVTSCSGQCIGNAVAVMRAQSFAADSSTFRLGAVELDSVLDIRLHRVQVAETYGALFKATGVASIVLDTALFRMGGSQGYTGFAVELDMLPGGTVVGRETEISDVSGQGLSVFQADSAHFEGLRVLVGGGQNASTNVSAAFSGVGRVTVRRGIFGGGRVWLGDSLLNDAKVMRLDTADFQNAQLMVRNLDTLVMHVAWMNAGGAAASVINADSVRVVSLVGVEASGVGYPNAVQILRGDSLRAESLYVHHNAGPGMYVDQFRTASLVGSRFVSNGSGDAIFYVPTVRVAQSLFEDQGFNSSLRWYAYTGAANTLTVDTTVFRGSGTGIFAQAYYAGRVTVRGSALERGPAGYGGRLLYAELPGRVQVLDSRVDSTAYGNYAVDVYTDTLDVLNTQMRFVGSGVQAYSYSGPSLLATVTGTTIGCRTGGGGSYYGLQLYNVDAVVTGNTVSGCWTGMSLYSSTPRSATISGNVVSSLDSANGQAGILLNGNWLNAVISGNTVSGGRMNYGGIYVAASSAIDSMRVDSNTIQDGRGHGIYLYGLLRGSRVRHNTIQRMRPLYSSYGAGIYAEYGYGTDTLRITDNRLLQNKSIGMYLAFGSGGAPIRLDSNVVVDDSLEAVKVEIGTRVVGRGNFIARNGAGIYGYGTITIDSSVIQQNVQYGARFVSNGPMTLINNYWGHISGPRCDTACAGAGDSILGVLNVAYEPFLTSAPTTPTGAPPALRPSAVFAAPASTLRAQAVEPAWFEQQRRAFAARRGGAR